MIPISPAPVRASRFAAVLALLACAATGCATTSQDREPVRTLSSEPETKFFTAPVATPTIVGESEEQTSAEQVMRRLEDAGWTTLHPRVDRSRDPETTTCLVKTSPSLPPTAVVDVKAFEATGAARATFEEMRKSAYRTARRASKVITVFCSAEDAQGELDCDRVLADAVGVP